MIAVPTTLIVKIYLHVLENQHQVSLIYGVQNAVEIILKPLIQPVTNVKSIEKDQLNEFIGATSTKTELRKPFKNITCKRRRLLTRTFFSNYNCRNSLRQ